MAENYFPNELKNGDISSLYKKDYALSRKNYWPITILSSTSKTFEGLLFDQLMPFAVKFLSPLLCICRRGYNKQRALLRFLETCKVTLDRSGYSGALLMDLAKAFDWIGHELVIAKLYAHGFTRNAFEMNRSYLSERHQRAKIIGSFGTCKEAQKGVPQGSALVPLFLALF